MKFELTAKGREQYNKSNARYKQLLAEGYTDSNAFDRVVFEQGKVNANIHVLANGVGPDWDSLIKAGLAVGPT